ncbi:MAG: phage major tail tube protein [Oceanospirillaceae bacterium]|nr:phage major tail tube protein [Oceanospirillaceae bacterium]
MSVKSEVLRNMNLIVDGLGYAGALSQVTPPKITIKTESVRMGGMDAEVDVDVGMEKLGIEYKLATYDPDIQKGFGLLEGQGIQHTIKGATQDRDGAVHAEVIQCQGKIIEIDQGTWEPGKQVEMTVKISLTYYKRERDGEVLHEIDVENNKRIIGGVDQLAAINNAIGL